MKNLKWRAILVFLVMLVSFVYLLPTISPSLPARWKKLLPSEKIHLGLDLQGGMTHLVLEVQAEKAVENQLERNVESLKDVFFAKSAFRFGLLPVMAHRRLN